MIQQVFYRYCTLDKRHQYSIVLEPEHKIWDQWVWFYLGRIIKNNKIHLYPYRFVYAKDKRLGEFRQSSAMMAAYYINKAIQKHRKGLKQ